jgi:hypothetical protein
MINSIYDYFYWLAGLFVVGYIAYTIIVAPTISNTEFTKSFFRKFIFRFFLFEFAFFAIGWWFTQIEGFKSRWVFFRNYVALVTGIVYLPVVLHMLSFGLALLGVPYVRWLNDTYAWLFPWPVLVGSWWLTSWAYAAVAVVGLNFTMYRWNKSHLVYIDNSEILKDTLMQIAEFAQAERFKIRRVDAVTYEVRSNAMIDSDAVRAKIDSMQNRIGGDLEIPTLNNTTSGVWEFTLCPMPYEQTEKGKWISTVTMDMLPPVPHTVDKNKANIESLYTYNIAYNTRPVLANRRAFPHELITGASNSGKTNYGACRTILFNRQNPQMVTVAVGIIKGLADFEPLQWNQDDLEALPSGADEMQAIRDGKIRKVDNLILIDTEEKFCRMIDFISIEMEKRMTRLKDYFKCKNYFDLLDYKINPHIDGPFKSALDIPRECWINLYITELTNMIDTYGDGQDNSKDDVGKAIGKLFTMVREARDRGIFICAEGQEGTIRYTGPFRRNSTISMFGVTPVEAKTQIGIEVHPPKVIGLRTSLGGGKHVTHETDCSAFMDDDFGRRILTDADYQLTDENYEFCLRLKGYVELEGNPSEIANKNKKILSLVRSEENNLGNGYSDEKEEPVIREKVFA